MKRDLPMINIAVLIKNIVKSQGAFIFTFAFIHSGAFAQTTTTIDYTTSSLSKTICNVFNTSPAPVVGGIAHYPLAGGATFQGSPGVVDLPTEAGFGFNPPAMEGIAYAMAYSTTPDISYTVTVYTTLIGADGTSPATENPMLVVGTLTTAKYKSDSAVTNPHVCNFVPQTSWGILDSNEVGTVYYVTKTPDTVTVTFLPHTSSNYIYILAQPSDEFGNGVLMISKIVITANPPTFTISPAAPPLTCYSTSTTFKANNVYGSYGVTGYTWNLGSGSGWKYNQNGTIVNAPATISTTADSLVLISPGGTTLPGNVSVTVSCNGSNYTSNAAVPTYFTPQPLPIVGPPGICTSANYSIPTLPLGFSVSNWSIVGGGGGSTLSLTPGTNNTLTITNNNYYTQTTTLTATISGCFPPSTLEVSAASPSSANLVSGLINQGPCFSDETLTNQTLVIGPPNFIYDYCPSITSISGPSNLHVALATGTPSQYSINGSQLDLTLNGAPVSFSAYQFQGGGCPTVTIEYMPRSDSQGPSAIATGTEQHSAYKLSPSPATRTIAIILLSESQNGMKIKDNQLVVKESDAPQKKHPAIETVKIFDVNGRLRQTYRYGGSTTMVELDVSHLENGVYFAEIFNGSTKETKKFAVQH